MCSSGSTWRRTSRCYIDCLLPGLFVLALGFGACQTGVAVAEDWSAG